MSDQRDFAELYAELFAADEDTEEAIADRLREAGLDFDVEVESGGDGR